MLKKIKLVALGSVVAVLSTYASYTVAVPQYAMEILYYSDASRTEVVGSKIIKCVAPYTQYSGRTTEHIHVINEGRCWPGWIIIH